MPHARGWIPDAPDERDLKLKAIHGPLLNRAKKVPSSINLASIMSAVRDQGEIGSCTAFAVAVGLAESIEIEHLRDPFIPLSPLFLYYATRMRSRQTHEDSGATIRDTVKTMAKVGCCPETDWPYVDVTEKFTQRPLEEAFADTARFRFHKYYRCESFDDVKLALAAKNPVVGGFQLYASFESDTTFANGIVPLPDMKHEQYLGGHAMSIFGYDDNGGADGRGHLILKNSWGANVGDKGLFYLPYDYFDPKLELVGDLWTATV